MADFDTTFDAGTDDAGATDKSRRGPSILLLLSAIAALVVSGWALIGPFSLDFLGTFDTGGFSSEAQSSSARSSC